MPGFWSDNQLLNIGDAPVDEVLVQMDTDRADHTGHIYLSLWERADLTPEIRDFIADKLTAAFNAGWQAGSAETAKMLPALHDPSIPF